MALSSCSVNRELLVNVVAKLNELSELSKQQAQARVDGDVTTATELDKKLDLEHAEKERRVGAWHQHVREHGC